MAFEASPFDFDQALVLHLREHRQQRPRTITFDLSSRIRSLLQVHREATTQSPAFHQPTTETLHTIAHFSLIRWHGSRP